jgi:predicted negative regulator of RcsB-dependent stress response
MNDQKTYVGWVQKEVKAFVVVVVVDFCHLQGFRVWRFRVWVSVGRLPYWFG